MRKELQRDIIHIKDYGAQKDILKWLIFAHFKEEVAVASFFLLINSHHPLKNETQNECLCRLP